jgi:diguanylate cyclase (GGDEF)-like protein
MPNPTPTYSVLYVGGPATEQQAIEGLLRNSGVDGFCRRAEDLTEFKEALDQDAWDAAILDSQAPNVPLPAALSLLSKSSRPIPAIVLADHSDEDAQIRYLKAGANYSVLRADLGRLLSILYKDRTTQNDHQRLLRQGYYDSLTGLPSRALMMEHLLLMMEHAERHRQKFALFFIDLDRFKHVNDHFGHARGDWLLQSATRRLSHGISEADLLARLGGDEFLLAAPIASLEDSAAIAHRLIQTMESPFSFDNHQVTVSASVGISIFPDHGDNLSTLLQCADQALYRAKGLGRNTYQFFSSALGTLATKEEVVGSSLLRALANRELGVVYQPQQNLHNGQVAGVEAFGYWQIPGFDFLQQEQFLETADKSGLIVDIEEFIWKSAFAQVRTWREENRGRIPLVLKVSPGHFVNRSVENFMQTLLHENPGFDPQAIILKMGMSTLMADEAPLLPTLHRLRDLGIQLILAWSGRSYFDFFKLRSLPVHTLSLGRALVWEATRDAAGAVTVQWLIQLAHHLGLRVIAEGVDTAPQLEFLKKNGCDTIQGSAYSPPLQADALAALWLQSNSTLIHA